MQSNFSVVDMSWNPPKTEEHLDFCASNGNLTVVTESWKSKKDQSIFCCKLALISQSQLFSAQIVYLDIKVSISLF